MLSLPDRPDFLLFKDVPRAQALLQALPVRRLRPGEVLIQPGTSGKELYLLVAGRLSVHLDTVENTAIAEIMPGQHTGEVSLVDGAPRSAWVVAKTHAEVLVVQAEVFWGLVRAHPQISVNALRCMARKVRGGNHVVTASQKLQEQYQRNASIDALTGLYNRRWLDELLARQVQRAQHTLEPLSVVMVDVDHFKRFNDTWGHQAGDYVLFVVGQVLKRCFRPTDLAARYGGEEFTVVMPQTYGPDAVRAADRVRRAIATTELLLGEQELPPVKVSMGVAELGPYQDAAALLHAADRALYQAKDAGRDRVCSWGVQQNAPLPGLL